MWAMETSSPTQVPPSSVLYKLDKIAYSTPPPVSSDPANNECKLIDYRGAKVASFRISGDIMICLPQAFELFLKHLVGGLHTVYTKLKRLNIVPVVCNVEQVRILRGLGAIQPGVNRCKLLTCKEFDILYEDCTTASSRPGRPPKRSLPLTLTPPMHMLPSLAQHAEHLKKPKLENGSLWGCLSDQGTLANLKSMGLHHFNGFDSRALAASPYLLTTHPALLATSQAMATNQANVISMAAAAVAASEQRLSAAAAENHHHMHNNHHNNHHSSHSNLGSPNGKASSLSGDPTGSDVSISPRSNDHDSDDGSGSPRDANSPSTDLTQDDIMHRRDSEKRHREAMAAMEHSLGKLCKPYQIELANARIREEARAREEAREAESHNRDDRHTNHHHSKSAHLNGRQIAVDISGGSSNSVLERLAASAAAANHHHQQGAPTLTLDRGPSAAELLVTQGASSIETLLTNIQGLLKVATDNARQMDKQTHLERAELKLELLRERELREALEKQLVAEQKRLAIIQKRLKKEKKAKRRLQEQVGGRVMENGSPDLDIKQSPADHLRALNGELPYSIVKQSLSQELEMERNARNAEIERNARNAELDRISRGSVEHERSSITAEIDRNGRSHEYERNGGRENGGRDSNGREMIHSPELDAARHGGSRDMEHNRVVRSGSLERDLPSRHEVPRSVGNDTERIQPLRSSAEPERKIPEHWDDPMGLHLRREEMVRETSSP